MRMLSRRSAAWLAVVLLLAVSTGCSQSPPPAPKTPSWDSPQAVLATAKAAATSHDYNTFCKCLSSESIDFLAGMLALSGAAMSAMDELPGPPMGGLGGFVGGMDDLEDQRAMQQMKAAKPKIMEILAKHGLSEELLKDPGRQSSVDSPADFGKLADPISDKMLFVEEMLRAFDSGGLYEPEDWMFYFGGELSDLEITGDKATATLLQEEYGEGFRTPMQFKKVDDRWLIDMSMTM